MTNTFIKITVWESNKKNLPAKLVTGICQGRGGGRTGELTDYQISSITNSFHFCYS